LLVSIFGVVFKIFSFSFLRISLMGIVVIREGSAFICLLKVGGIYSKLGYVSIGLGFSFD
jgi:hypothetical protein